jgi:hypothetical protein
VAGRAIQEEMISEMRYDERGFYYGEFQIDSWEIIVALAVLALIGLIVWFIKRNKQ